MCACVRGGRRRGRVTLRHALTPAGGIVGGEIGGARHEACSRRWYHGRMTHMAAMLRRARPACCNDSNAAGASAYGAPGASPPAAQQHGHTVNAASLLPRHTLTTRSYDCRPRRIIKQPDNHPTRSVCRRHQPDRHRQDLSRRAHAGAHLWYIAQTAAATILWCLLPLTPCSSPRRPVCGWRRPRWCLLRGYWRWPRLRCAAACRGSRASSRGRQQLCSSSSNKQQSSSNSSRQRVT